MQSFLDKEFNYVYLLSWSIFCAAMSESEAQDPFPGGNRPTERCFEMARRSGAETLFRYLLDAIRRGLG